MRLINRKKIKEEFTEKLSKKDLEIEKLKEKIKEFELTRKKETKTPPLNGKPFFYF